MSNRIIASGLVAVALLAVAACTTTGQTGLGKPEYMVVGIDNKVTWGEDGKVQNLAPGKDAVTIVDIGTDPANPKIVAHLKGAGRLFAEATVRHEYPHCWRCKHPTILRATSQWLEA